MSFRIRMAEGWRGLHKKSSVVMSGLAGLIIPGATALREAWASMPPDLKAVIPQSMQQAISYTILAGIFIACRYTAIERKQKGDQQ